MYKVQNTINVIAFDNILSVLEYNFYEAFFTMAADTIVKHFRLYDSENPDCPINLQMMRLFGYVPWPSRKYGGNKKESKEIADLPTGNGKYLLLRRIQCKGVYVCPGGKIDPDTLLPIVCPVISAPTRPRNEDMVGTTKICKLCKQTILYKLCEARLAFYIVRKDTALYGAVYSQAHRHTHPMNTNFKVHMNDAHFHTLQTIVQANPTLSTADLLLQIDNNGQTLISQTAFGNPGRIAVIRRQILGLGVVKDDSLDDIETYQKNTNHLLESK